MDDVLPTMSTSERTSYIADVGRSDDDFDVDPPQKPGANGAEVTLIFEPKPVPTEPEDGERGSNEEEEYLRFTAYLPPAHMHNVDLSVDDALEFSNLPYKRLGHTSSSLNLGILEVGKDFSRKDGFLGALKQYNIMNGLNLNLRSSRPSVQYDMVHVHGKSWL
ncbi:hypothetical protein J1N35_008045 [Gossypium stocksii]|uniref:Transposase MuDR plant domain-containing protein n=1 Tax=Gossypium stocksii TaxID=47602 RepID=A0A9D3W835_9ROSI|nr:hypothetical protein J1N35_008045 [Gossypium stocksii]